MQTAVLNKGTQSLETQLTTLFETIRKESPPQTDQWHKGGNEFFQQRLRTFIKNDVPLEFLLPAFPGKSQNNETKVLGPHADLAEKAALRTIQDFVEGVEDIYGRGGVRFRILSDGYVFGPVVGISDENIARYEQECKEYLSNQNILWQGLSYFFPQGDNNQKRAELDRLYAPDLSELTHSIKTDPETNKLYCGMKHFMQEDFKPSEQRALSGEKKQKLAKKKAKALMQRNIAYTRAHQERLAHCIRLSIHPCANNGEKFSINLIPGDNTWATPWHRSPVMQKDGQVVLLKRNEAEQAGYKLVEKNGRPYTFREV